MSDSTTVDGAIYDHLVIGAGPAGLQLARHLKESGSRYTIVEAGEAAGTFFATFPRHRTLISSNKPHTGTTDPELNLRMDWNSLLSGDPQLLFTRYTERYFPPADLWRQYLADFAAASELNIHYNTRVVRIERPEAGGPFTVTAQDGSVRRAAIVIVATGVSKPYIPPIPGIEHAEQYATMTVDPADFTDQRVLILGKGNSAFETADNLIEKAAVIHVAGPDGVRLAWKTHYVGHLRAVNNNFLDTYQLKSQNAILDGEVLSITPKPGGGFLVRFSFVRADEVVKELYYDRILCCTGFRLDTEPFAEECAPALVIKDRFAELTSAFESVNVPGLYFAGTLMQQREFKKATTGFIHGYRYTVKALSRILDQRGAGVVWPNRPIAATPQALADATIERVNRSSALWQQFGVMADIILLPGDGGGQAHYVDEVPLGYALDGGLADPDAGLADDGLLVSVTLEYGPDHDKVDRFDATVKRPAQDDADEAHNAAYLHPVLRVYRDGKALAEHHLAENLENHWDGEASHRAPLVAFFEKVATL
ncbi:FAD-dependent pyridine nucleotide-disulphide oxidoreductase [Catenulispora acidiphila DSM 44928]|uniref:FAD-dependent pyridine nucleotide-disulphide oxidoreductase n=1 Tax=Catenulispora acidiphila (strain DSM 44928 / JCM 14897 / NBRC 102108 / NRRL B-24433 / ID139908) TaxID=479433 RepID=C7QGC5_CATAD|nr:NAD(P)-binding domain-containing protein [Catenulispora acidiphila]ACU72970.1 FAD-dependent pyridine nucleotide-disulphide oxidoreductase [Catenulispora acidiphila DSM 44928]